MIAQLRAEDHARISRTAVDESLSEVGVREQVIDLRGGFPSARLAERGRESTLNAAQALDKSQSDHAIQILSVAARAAFPRVERFAEVEVTTNDQRAENVSRSQCGEQ
jgi:hypothetical protein